ncbi:two-component system regulatory protein YycI [Anaerotignum propionicum]|uniref:YycH protein n=1 Tax=Anaerotignum propionicum DSM 1682 TaxID=991789 RepID=A0A0X8VC71_ANAPI|nr:two-component system regulatory protein YycI [Anaerotignum propionicum]AMJ42238.1 YycH protein [Anaerotignum propionicum DSM 1682]SHE54536.1 YycH protein [[Clostridium] propionicum DSM 1682] [Anaerotignum propionicum DSM 1682]
MEWTVAKRFVIILLVIINVVLAGLNMKQKQDNSMSSSQEKAIFQVLSQNGITLYTDLNIDIHPMDRLEARVPSYSKEELETVFFDGGKTKVSPGTKTIYKGESKTLVLSGDRGSFTDQSIKKGVSALGKEDAIKQAERKMEKMKRVFGNYDLSYVSKTEEDWQVEFSSVQDDRNIFSNHFTFFVSDEGIYQVDFTYCEITGTTQEKKDIYMADEALLTFMREWNKGDAARDAAIQKIELGYDLLEQGEAVSGTGLYLEPCYRIYLMEEREPYLVNAYTCQIVKKND